jgi:membrane-bound serine protease (ClpP class)
MTRIVYLSPNPINLLRDKLQRRTTLILILIGIILAAHPQITLAASNNRILIAKIDSDITAATSGMVNDALSLASSMGARLIVFEVDTPGGEVNAVRSIMDSFEFSKTPVCVYVSPIGAAAWSGGTYLLISSHLAAMASGTSIGSAQPVSSAGQLINDTKHINALTALMVNHAEFHGRNTTAAEMFVRQNLNFGPAEALRYGVVEFIADDLETLLGEISGKVLVKTETAEGLGRWRLTDAHDSNYEYSLKYDFSELDRADVVYYTPGIQTTFLQIIFNPLASSLMFVVGFALLITGLHTPGLGAELAGGILLLLSLLAFQVVGIEPMIVLFFTVGLALIVAELKTHIGVLGLGGVICLIFSSFLLFPSPQWLIAPEVSYGIRNTLVAVSLTLSAFFAILVWKVAQARRLKVKTGYESIVGQIGITATRLAPEGEVRFQGETWRARSTTGVVEKGVDVIVEGRDGLKLLVKPPSMQLDPQTMKVN